MRVLHLTTANLLRKPGRAEFSDISNNVIDDLLFDCSICVGGLK